MFHEKFLKLIKFHEIFLIIFSEYWKMFPSTCIPWIFPKNNHGKQILNFTSKIWMSMTWTFHGMRCCFQNTSQIHILPWIFPENDHVKTFWISQVIFIAWIFPEMRYVTVCFQNISQIWLYFPWIFPENKINTIWEYLEFHK